MNDEELKRLWCKQKLDATKLSPDEQINLMRIKLNALDRVSRLVDAMTIVVAVGMIVVFVGLGWYLLKISLLARIGLGIMIASCAFDIWKPILARMTPPSPAEAPVTEWLRHELEKVRAECELSRSRLLWDLVPFWIGSIIFCGGLDGKLSPRIFLSALLTGTSVILYVSSWKLKLHTRRKADQPLIEELESLLKSNTPE